MVVSNRNQRPYGKTKDKLKLVVCLSRCFRAIVRNTLIIKDLLNPHCVIFATIIGHPCGKNASVFGFSPDSFMMKDNAPPEAFSN